MKNYKTMYANYKILGGGGLASMMVWITGVNGAQDLLVGVRSGFEAKKVSERLMFVRVRNTCMFLKFFNSLRMVFYYFI